MLHIIRERIQGWIAGAIVLLLIIPFALWGINQYFGSGGAAVVASVNGEDISQQDFQQAFSMQRNRMREMLGGQYNASLFDAQIKRQTLQDLIDRELLFQKSKDEGFRIAESSVVQTIQGIDAFRENGVFSNDLYVRALQAQGESPAAFEQRIRRAILTQQLQSGVTATATVSEQQVDRILQLQDQMRDIDYIKIEAVKYQNDADATDETIEKYYNDHTDAFMTPEKVSIEYVELKAANLGTNVEPTEDELKQFYEERASQFRVPEERRSRHILIAVKEGADAQTIEKAKEKANEVHQKLLAGESFEKLAEKYSDDPGSSKLGGEIGFFGRGNLDTAYENTLFSMKVGDVSEPILSSFGFHIIQLEEIRAEKSKSFEEVKEELKTEYRKEKADRKFFEQVDKLTTLAYEVPTTLNDAAGAVGLEVKSTDLFGRNGGAGIAANPKVTAAAFSEEVLNQGYNSEPVEIGEGDVVVLRVKEHVPASPRSLADAKEDIKQKLLQDKARERVIEKGRQAVKRLNDGENAQTLAQELGGEWQKAGELKRNDRKIDSAIVKQAFKLDHPTEGKARFGGIVLGNGDYALIAVNKVVDGESATVDEAQKLNLKRNLAGVQGENEFSNLLEGMKKSATIVIKNDEL